MNNLVEKFEELFQTIVEGKAQDQELVNADVIFLADHHTCNFSDVDFMMATDRNGASYLYSVEHNGSCFFSVIDEQGHEFSMKQSLCA